jgi:predicted CXXCH cytochrome family protein
MKMRFAILAVAVMVIFITMSGAAFAAYPHGDFASNPDACAACHRMHTATGKNLIKDSSGGTCLSCHKNALAADADVMNGVYTDPSGEDATAPGHTWGVNGVTLLGGGFNYVGGPTAATSTSKHRVDETLVPPGSNGGASIIFACTSCHSAHPDKAHPDQYRLLRLRPNGVTSDFAVAWNGPWDDESQTATSTTSKYRAYTEHDFDAGTTGVQYVTNNYQSGIAGWCTTCHTKYMATEGSAATRGDPSNPSASVYASGDQFGNVARYRHAVNVPIVDRLDPINNVTYDLVTSCPLEDPAGNGRTADDLLTCLSCHRAHGSDSVMSGDSNLPQAERQAATTVLPYGTDSMLLRGDRGRRICADCHNF